MSEFKHVSIMVGEVLSLLEPARGGIYVDGTLGGGGHSLEIIKRIPRFEGRLYGIDRDADAVAAASERLSDYSDMFTAVRGNFFDMKRLLSKKGVDGVDGILLDLGVSSYQLDTKERGFSYNADAPLDMRMDEDANLSAFDVVNGYGEDDLTRIIRDYGEERYANRIARAIIRAREEKSVATTLELAEIIKRAMPGAARREQQHPAKRTFQAIRIEVNGELDGLYDALSEMAGLLNSGGVLAVITFHSLEDRPVKQLFKKLENPCTCDPKAPICTCGRVAQHRILTKKPMVASDDEIAQNPRARSAKLRAIQRV